MDMRRMALKIYASDLTMSRVIFKLKHDTKKALNNNQFKLMVSFFLFVLGFLCAKRDGGTGQMENTLNNCSR